jgi:threonine/homoserine/homoserine lactone efflux protein
MRHFYMIHYFSKLVCKERDSMAMAGINLSFLFKGLFIGFAIAAPVGPIGILCIRRTLANGRLVGFFSGLGAASADMSYGAVAAFGLTVIQNLLIGVQFWLHILGGLFLIYLGIHTFLTKPVNNKVTESSGQGLLQSYLSTVGLTLTNPTTIISFTVIFAALRLSDSHGNNLSAILLVFGVFLGSSAWWMTLSFLVGLVREKFTPGWMMWVNRFAGLMIFGFGLTALVIK